MSIRISRDKCRNCGRCQDVCPGNLIAGKEGAAWMERPEECWGCASCVKACPFGAISFYLGVDMGGRGSIMTVEGRGRILSWKIRRSDGSVETVDVDSGNANSY